MFRFENTHAFQLLFLLPLLWLVAFVFARRSLAKMKKVMGEKIYPFLSSSVSSSKRRWKLILQSLVLFFMILALARPQMGESKQEVRSEGIEIMLLVDVSDSMKAEDVRPNRLSQLKAEMSKLAEMLPGSKIGIIAFAGSATLLSPLTTDPSSLKMYLDSLSTDSVSSQGTDFHRALIEAREAFKRGGVGDAKDELVKVTRAILVASDGEDQEPGALDEAEKMAQEGIRIFALAYGTEKGAPIPQHDGNGYLLGYKKDSHGQTVLTTVKGEALSAMAQKGQGQFYHASFGGTHLKKIVEAINTLEKTQFESEMATQYDEKFQTFLLLALILALLEMLLGERKSSSQLWKGRFQ